MVDERRGTKKYQYFRNEDSLNRKEIKRVNCTKLDRVASYFIGAPRSFLELILKKHLTTRKHK